MTEGMANGIDGALSPDETRLDLIRSAIERELRARRRGKEAVAPARPIRHAPEA